MRPAILTAFALLAVAFTGCKPRAPEFVVTDAAETSPDDAPVTWPEVKPVSVPAAPAKQTEAPAGYECGPNGCGPARSFREEQPVRRVFQRLPIVRRFGR